MALSCKNNSNSEEMEDGGRVRLGDHQPLTNASKTYQDMEQLLQSNL